MPLAFFSARRPRHAPGRVRLAGFAPPNHPPPEPWPGGQSPAKLPRAGPPWADTPCTTGRAAPGLGIAKLPSPLARRAPPGPGPEARQNDRLGPENPPICVPSCVMECPPRCRTRSRNRPPFQHRRDRCVVHSLQFLVKVDRNSSNRHSPPGIPGTPHPFHICLLVKIRAIT